MCTPSEHKIHRATAMEGFYDQHGDEARWTMQELAWEEALLAKVDFRCGVVSKK